MLYLWITLGIIAFIIALFFTVSFICYRMAFYVPERTSPKYKKSGIPDGIVYGPFKDTIKQWAEETQKLDSQEFFITAFDGLKLCGRFYEYKKGAPIELMFHGYRGNALRDLAGGVQRCFKLKRSAFIVDQRASEKSEGNVISFGINEYKDCLCWVDFLIKHFGSDVKIILTGISMGASTVLMAAGQPLPKNVIGVLADCGYNSPKDIIKKVIREMGLPADLSYFFVKMGARIYGKFDLEETTPEQALENCTLPVIFFHGDNDDYVPCQMSKINFDACKSKKELVFIKGAGHGLSYPVDPEYYLKTLKDFFGEEASFKE